MTDHDNPITKLRARQRGEFFNEICERRFSRREVLKAGVAAGGVAALGTLAGCGSDEEPQVSEKDRQWQAQNPYASSYDFIEIEHGIDEHHHVAPDHQTQILLRWGDRLFEDAPEFDIEAQTVEAQLKQFGYNNDYIGYLSLEPKHGQDVRALLCVNHEYPIHGLMFPDLIKSSDITAEQVRLSQASVGCSVVEVNCKDGVWEVELDSHYNRRISALETEIEITGPAAGHPRLQTQADPSGRKVIGTMNNCAGGITPWGTYLTCEENIDYSFNGELPSGHREEQAYKCYGIPKGYNGWGKQDPRFNLAAEPNEPNRFGWVVEIDPMDRNSTPKKRTALGRMKHEGGENIIASDGRLVVYMGDDEVFEYLYKFVSRDKVSQGDPDANANLLDHGTLYVAKFHDDGLLEWLPLEISNPLLKEEYESQADILIETRQAADLLGATPMDRPEDVVPSPKTGKVYVVLTNNTKRKSGNAANPRPNNVFGHVIEISEFENNNASTRGYWSLLVQGGDPRNPAHGAQFHSNTSEHGWFVSPDNGTFDPDGRFWVTSDQGPKTNLSGTNDGLWALETEGPNRGTGKMFFRVPSGAEMSGPIFSDDGESLFLSVQHPGDIESRPGSARFDTALTQWPDFKDGMPPRPSLVVVTRKGGGKVG